MRVGITGTRFDITDVQIVGITKFLNENFTKGSELHHGDCVGADACVAQIAKDIGYKIVCHPPIDASLRAFFASDETRKPLTYFARNRNIVNETECLIVAPYQNEWQPKGGTWYTHDYAEKKNKPLFVFYPDSEMIRQLIISREMK